MTDRTFIVAEVSKNWPQEPGTPETLLSERFEDVINHNLERGYELLSRRLHRWSPEPGLLNETIIAVFVLRSRR